jgi:hypothetical protein
VYFVKPSISALTSSAWHFRLGLQPSLQFLLLTASLCKRKFMDAESSVTPDTLINLPLSVTDATVSGLSEHCSYKGADMVPTITAQNTKHKWGYVHISYFHHLAKADIFLGKLKLQSYFTFLPHHPPPKFANPLSTTPRNARSKGMFQTGLTHVPTTSFVYLLHRVSHKKVYKITPNYITIK